MTIKRYAGVYNIMQTVVAAGKKLTSEKKKGGKMH